MRMHIVPVVVVVFVVALSADLIDPPFNGTVWNLRGELITDADPTSFRRAEYTGEHERHMLVASNTGACCLRSYEMAHVFDAEFQDRRVEFQVHSDTGSSEEARALVDVYAPIFGRLPRALRQHVREIELHWQDEGCCCNAAFYDNPDPSAGAIRCNAARANHEAERGFMEEIFLHEAVHVSLDPDHRLAAGWLEAQHSDPTFISDYARDNPRTEDLAETFSAWFAVRFRPDRITADQQQKILDAVPARLAYLDRQNFEMSPYVRAAPVPALPLGGLVLFGLVLFWVRRLASKTVGSIQVRSGR